MQVFKSHVPNKIKDLNSPLTHNFNKCITKSLKEQVRANLGNRAHNSCFKPTQETFCGDGRVEVLLTDRFVDADHFEAFVEIIFKYAAKMW